MAFTLAFAVSQGVDSTSATVIDSSTGSDGNVTDRHIVVTTNDGTFLVPAGTTTSYIDFPFSDGGSKLLLDIFPIDYAPSITLQYLNVSGTVLYSLSQNYSFVGNDNDFDYSLTQQLVGNQNLLADTNYVNNRFTLRMLIDSAQQAVITGNDINGSQFLLDLAQVYVQNQNLYF